MEVPDQAAVRRAVVNGSRSRSASMAFPTPWPPARADDLDFLGWADPKAPRRGYLVVDVDGLAAVELRLPGTAPTGRSTMCDLCRTQDAPDGARLVVAARAGSRGREGDSVGLYVCGDFGCSLRARLPLKPHQVSVTGQPDLRVPELVERVVAFVDRVRLP